MATSLDDLLGEAQDQVWRAAQELPTGLPAARRRAREVVEQHLAAWPSILSAAERALLADAPGSAQPAARFRPTWEALVGARDAVGERYVGGVPDPGLSAVGARLGAAADAMTTGSGGIAAGTLDRVLAVVESSARITAIYAEQIDRPGRGKRALNPALWRRLGDAAGAAVVTDPMHRAAVTGARPLLAPDEQMLAATLERWHAHAGDLLTPTSVPAANVPAVARGLEMIHAAALATGGPEGHATAARAWRAAVDEWGPTLRIPGPVDRDFGSATHSLRDELTFLVAAHREAPREQRLPVLDLRVFVADRLQDVATSYGAQTQRIIESELAIGSAKHIVAAMRQAGIRGVLPAGVTQAALRPAGAGRGWVPLPASSPQAAAIDTTTATAIAATRSESIIGSGESAAAMRAATPGFGSHPIRSGLVTTPAVSPQPALSDRDLTIRRHR